MGKVLIATFDDKEETTFDELLSFLKSKSHIKVLNTFPNDSCLRYDNLVINAKYRMIERNGESIELTNYEFEILYLLAQRPGQVFSKEQIYNQVWKEPYYGAEDNVMSLIRRIRKKIEPDPAKPIFILTVWGVGYRFNPHVARQTI